MQFIITVDAPKIQAQDKIWLYHALLGLGYGLWAPLVVLPESHHFGEIMISWLDARDAQEFGITLAKFLWKESPG